LNDSPETLRVLLLSPVIRRTENEHLLEALLSLCKNMNLNVDQLTHNKDAVAAKEHMEKDLEDFGMLFNRREMFPDLVLVAPRHEPSSSTTTLVGEVSAVRRPRNVTAAAHNDSSGGGEGEGLIYCHRAILAARCKVFAALFLRWEASDDEEGNDKESGEEKDNGSLTAPTAASGGGRVELDDDGEEEPKKRKKKEAKATKKKATGAKDLKKKRKRDGPPEHKHIRRKKDAQSNGTAPDPAEQLGVADRER
jgi:hypothetical protein